MATHALSSSCPSPSPSSSSDDAPSSSTSGVCTESDDDASLELVIQYGSGQSPVSFLPSAVLSSRLDATTELNEDSPTSISILTQQSSESQQKEQRCCTTQIKWYRFKPSLSHDIERADLILCHAGAGTLLEALSIASKSKAVPYDQTDSEHIIINAVINSKLMDNHQSELAEELEQRRHILVTRNVEEWITREGADTFWKNVADFHAEPFVGRGVSACGDGVSSFQRIVDRVVGIATYSEDEATVVDSSGAKKTR